MEDIEKPTNDLQVSSLPMSVSLPTASAVLFFFPLTHSLMVIYLVGKGSAFSPARSTTGREREPREERSRRQGEKERGIYHSCLFPRRHPALPPTLPHSCNGSEGSATDGGMRKRITCQYLFPPAARIESDTLHSLSLFPPLKPIQELYLLLGIKSCSGVLWETARRRTRLRRKGMSARRGGREDD